MSQNKKIHIEIMRVLAIFFVVFNHTQNDGFFLFSRQYIGSFRYWFYMLFSIFCKFSVPLFLCISGALILEKKETIKEILSKRILRITIVLISFSFICYLQYIQLNAATFSIKEFMMKMYTGNWNGAYWYLDIYIVFLLSLPFLRSMVKGLDKSSYYFMMTLCIIYCCVIPILQYLFLDGNTLNNNLKLEWLLSQVVYYPVLGYFLENNIDVSGDGFKKKLLLLWFIDMVLIFASCMLTYHRHLKLGYCNEWDSQIFHMLFQCVNVPTIYVTVKYITQKDGLNKLIKKIVYILGDSTFGVYLLHMLFMKNPHIKAVLVFLKEVCKINDFVAVMIYCIFICILSYLVTFLLRKIPIMRKII